MKFTTTLLETYRDICTSLTEAIELPESPERYNLLQKTLLRVGDLFPLPSQIVQNPVKDDDTHLFLGAIDNLASKLKSFQEKLTPEVIEPDQLIAYRNMCETMQDYLNIQKLKLKNWIATIEKCVELYAYKETLELYLKTISLNNKLAAIKYDTAYFVALTLLLSGFAAVSAFLFAPWVMPVFICFAIISLVCTMHCAIEHSTVKHNYQKAKLGTERQLERLGLDSKTPVEKFTKIAESLAQQRDTECRLLGLKNVSLDAEGRALLESISTTNTKSVESTSTTAQSIAAAHTFFSESKAEGVPTSDTTDIHHEDDKFHENASSSSLTL